MGCRIQRDAGSLGCRCTVLHLPLSGSGTPQNRRAEVGAGQANQVHGFGEAAMSACPAAAAQAIGTACDLSGASSLGHAAFINLAIYIANP